MTREDANYYLKSSGFSDEQIDTIAKAYTEPCEDEYIKVPKKALKYRTAGMVAYNAEWLKNHFDIERAVILGCEYKEQEPKTGHWEWVQYNYNPQLGNWHCSECRCVVVECVGKEKKGGIPLYKYCPQCGAKMEVSE